MVHFRSIALLSLLIPSALGLAIQRDDLHADVDAAVNALSSAADLRKMTNADRFAKGLGPLPPTRRSTAGKAKRSSIPQSTDPTAQTTDDDPNFGGPLTIRLRNPRDGSDMGAITMPNRGSDGDLVNFDPNTGRPQRFQFGQGQPFEIYPMDDDAFYGGRTPLLGAKPVPGRRPALGQGNPDFLHVGLAHPGDDGLLDIRLPSRLLAGGPTGGLLDLLVGDLLPGGSDEFYPAEGTMWTFDPKTRRLIAHYTNPNGQAVPTYFVTGGPCQHLICLTADVEAFRNAFGDDALELHALVTVL